MRPEFAKELEQYVLECEAKGIELPRMGYFGHTLVETYEDSNDAKWRCVHCSHEWVGYDGFKCPNCGTIKGK